MLIDSTAIIITLCASPHSHITSIEVTLCGVLGFDTPVGDDVISNSVSNGTESCPSLIPSTLTINGRP